MQIQSLSDQTQGITALGASTPTTTTSPPPTAALNGTLSGIAQQLGMSVSNVQSAIKQGSSIADLAQQHGVSTSSIVSSVESQIQATRQANGQQPLDQTTLDRMVTRAVTHHHHRGGAAAALAGTTTADASSTSATSDTTGSSFSTLA